MWKDIKWLRLTPDRAGRGGTKTGIHSFQQTPVNDIRSLSGAHVYRGYWRRDFDSQEYPTAISEHPDTAGLFPLGIHGYTFPSLTNPAAAPTIKILQQNVHPGACVIWDATSGTTRQTRPGTNQMGTFLNIGGRCFFGDGETEALVMDDRTPAIHSQPNQRLGIATPTQPLAINAFGNVTAYGSGYIHGGSYYLNHPNPDNPLKGCIAGDTVTITPPNATANASGWQGFAPQPAPYVLTLPAVTSNTTPFAAAGTISITTGTSVVTLAGSTWPVNRQYAGLAINFNGYSYVILTHGYAGDVLGNYDINGNLVGVIPPLQLYILGVYDGPSLVGVPYTITGVQVTLDPPPAVPSLAQYLNTGLLGYSQSTNGRLFQVKVECTRVNGFKRNLGNISLGPVGGGSQDFVTDTRVTGGVPFISSPTAPWVASDVGKTIVIDMQGTASMHITTIGSFTNTSQVTLDTSPGGVTLVPATRSWWGTGFVSCVDAIIAAPGSPATLTSASNPFSVNDVGKTIMIEKAGVGGVVAAFTTIASFVDAGTITVSTAGAAVAGVVAAWGGALVNTHAGPTYAYAWYDPETGHCSNISPLFTIPRPTTQGAFTDFANITPAFQIDPGYISYPDGTVVTGTITPGTPTSDAVRFSHIVFFRTLSTPGSSTLYPIGSLMPFTAKVHPGSSSTRGSWSPNLYHGWHGLPNNYAYAPAGVGSPNYWYDFSSDSDLLLAGGFRAPQFTNEKPMVLLRGGITQPANPYLMAHWDRRLWCVPTQDPDKLIFSCDDAQCPLGVPEESFPPTNFLRLPSAADGKFLGLRTFGDMLVATTQRFAYIVAGNNESNYRLMKISSSMPGVGQYQMDEFPTYTGAEGEPTTVFFLGTDRIVYQWTIGGAVVPISQPIQDQLDTYLQLPSGQYFNSTVHCVSAWGRRLVVVGPNFRTFGTTGLLTFVYDINAGVWSQSTRHAGSAPNPSSGGIGPMTTVYGASNIPVSELYSIPAGFGIGIGIHTISWIRDDITSASLPMRLDTFPLTFDGKKTRKQLVAINLHATPGTWLGALNVNDQFGPGLTFTTYPDPINSIYAPTGVQVAIDDVVASDLVTLAGNINTDGAPVVGYRFTIIITKTATEDTLPANIYAIDVGYIDMPSPGDGDA